VEGRAELRRRLPVCEGSQGNRESQHGVCLPATPVPEAGACDPAVAKLSATDVPVGASLALCTAAFGAQNAE
jgi:hypothetical protein